MIGYVHRGIFVRVVADHSGPKIPQHGQRFDPPYPKARWERRLLANPPPRAGFQCTLCAEPVLITRGENIQQCRCAYLVDAPEHELRSDTEWSTRQEQNDQELKDPAPEDYWAEPMPNTEGGLTGTGKVMTPDTKEWFKRKFYLPPELIISDDGDSLSLPGIPGGYLRLEKPET